MSDDGSVLAEIEALEMRLLDPAVRVDPAALEALLHPEFVEFGTSGRMWSREAIISSLLEDPGNVGVTVDDLHGAFVADGCVLLTYSTVKQGRIALRSSLWCHDGLRWRIRFHQGTPVP